MTEDEAAAALRTAQRRATKPRQHKGLVLVFTGNGKGKSTAAFGLVLRALGNRLAVLVVQFIKGQWKTGERTFLQALAPTIAQVLGAHVEMYQMGRGFTIERLRDPRIPLEDHRQAAREALAFVQQALPSGRYQMVVLDEILGSVSAGLVTEDEVLALIAAKPADVHLVLTGRGASERIVAAADLVTEMREVKHHYKAGITAQRGIEF
jgi:cob(I)alamin adenosyltransferase